MSTFSTRRVRYWNESDPRIDTQTLTTSSFSCYSPPLSSPLRRNGRADMAVFHPMLADTWAPCRAAAGTEAPSVTMRQARARFSVNPLKKHPSLATQPGDHGNRQTLITPSFVPPHLCYFSNKSSCPMCSISAPSLSITLTCKHTVCSEPPTLSLPFQQKRINCCRGQNRVGI